MEPIFRHMLVPTDFSEGAAHALRLAIRLARHGKGRITLLHVAAPPDAGTFDFPAYRGSLPEVLVQLHQDLLAQRGHELRRVAAEEIPEDVPWAPKLTEGRPSDQILLEAGSGDYDVVVIGTRGHSGLTRALLGSVAEHVVRMSPIPVLVTR